MSTILNINTKSLNEIAVKINSLYNTMQTSYMETAALFDHALEHDYDDDVEDFMEWAKEFTPYSERQIKKHLTVYEEFGRAAESFLFPIPINVLERLALQKDKIPLDTRRKVLRMYQNKKSHNRPSEKQALTFIAESLPEKEQKQFNYMAPMAERLDVPKGYVLVAEKLLDVSNTASSETVKILAKHWKHKYHPDKGGDPESFKKICNAEQVLLKKRGEK